MRDGVKSFFGALLGGLTLFAGIAIADRSVVFSSRSAKVERVALELSADGGCQASVCGAVLQADGGEGYSRCHAPVDLEGPAQSRCLQFMNSADGLWRVREGL
jgi:hypothetical protein